MSLTWKAASGLQAALSRLADLPEDIRGDDLHRLYQENNIAWHPINPVTMEFDVHPHHQQTTTHSREDVLHTSQQRLHKPTLEQFIREGHEHMTDEDYADESGHSTEPFWPETYRHQGKDWVYEGHHRILASRMKGEPALTAHYRDVDAENHDDPDYHEHIDYDREDGGGFWKAD